MTQDEKQLLLKGLCGRLPYGVKVKYRDSILELGYSLYAIDGTIAFEKYPMIYFMDKIDTVKPYLRPMSSMTQEERDEIEEISHGWFYVNEDGEIFPVGQLTDSAEFEDAILPTLERLNKKMFDYRGLIPMGLALEAPEGMYE